MSVHKRKQGSTELETVTIKEQGVPLDLTNVTTVTWWQREVGASSNKVSNGTMVITDAVNGICTFDPEGAGSSGTDAFDTAVDYEVYTRLVWSDGDITRHPDEGYEIFSIEPFFE